MIKEFFKVCMLFVGFLLCIHMPYTIVEEYYGSTYYDRYFRYIKLLIHQKSDVSAAIHQVFDVSDATHMVTGPVYDTAGDTSRT